MNENEPILLRVSEAASLLQISRSKAYELVAKGEIPSLHIGASIRVPAAALKALVERAMRTTIEEKCNEIG